VKILIILKMVNMTLAVPDELHKLMKKHPEIKWSEVARMALWDKAEKLAYLDKVFSKSKLTKKDVIELSREIKREIARKHGLRK